MSKASPALKCTIKLSPHMQNNGYVIYKSWLLSVFNNTVPSTSVIVFLRASPEYHHVTIFIFRTFKKIFNCVLVSS